SHAVPYVMVDDLCEHLHTLTVPDVELLCQFAREFFFKVPRQLLGDRTVAELAAITLGAFDFMQDARKEGVTVQVINPEEEGWDAPVTVIRADVGDRPFIVDTIREYLSGENLPILHYVYRVVGI